MSGARKITDYVGKFIMDNYAIEDQRENEAYSSWHEDYEAYTDFKIDIIQKEEELKNYLTQYNEELTKPDIYYNRSNRLYDIGKHLYDTYQ